jgi:hypothetical protein
LRRKEKKEEWEIDRTNQREKEVIRCRNNNIYCIQFSWFSPINSICISLPFRFYHFNRTCISILYNIYCLSFFLIGIVRGKIVSKPLLRAGLNTLAVGGIAASVAYVIGYILGITVK